MTTQDDEPELNLVRSLNIRRTDTTPDTVAAHIADLLDSGVAIIDLSDHDRHGDTVHLRAGTPKALS